MTMPYSLQKEVIDTIEWYYVLDEETSRVIYASQALIEQCGPQLMEKTYREALAGSPLLRIFEAPLPPEGRLEWELAIGEQNSYLLIRNRRIWYEGHKCRVGVLIHASDVVGISRDMSQLIAEYQEVVSKNEQLLGELNWNAYHDCLTSLYNRNKYINDCNQLFDHESGYGIMSLDINNLKYINDHYGHEQGDCLIRCVGQALKMAEEDGRTYCYRVGGDEFVLVQLNSTEEELRAVCDQICNYIAGAGSLCPQLDGANPYDGEPREYPAVHVSAGYALAGPGMDFKTVFKLADDRMYTQKRGLKSGEGRLTRQNEV